MRKILNIKIEKPQYVLCEDVAFSMPDNWFGHTVRNLKMDIIYPEDKTKKYPCIIWICGGAWLTMDKGAHLPYLSNLAQEGFVVASVEYRTSNMAEFPAQIQDIKNAIRFLRKNSERFSIDSNKIGVSGESAGGHLTCLAALMNTGDDSSVQAACPWYPPSDFLTFPNIAAGEYSPPENLLLGYDLKKYPERAKDVNPLDLVSEKAPPFLIIHGNKDSTVPFSQGEALYNALEKKGCDVTLLEINEADHADIRFFQKEIWAEMSTFFHRVLG